MKRLIFSITICVHNAQALRKRPDDDRRYNQLTDMMKFENPDFDERKYWTYGCNCLIIGDRPMTDPGFGPPVDDLDRVCKVYKDCLKCARRQFGDECINEFTRYNFRKNIKLHTVSLIFDR